MISSFGLILCLVCDLPKWCYVINLGIGIAEILLMIRGDRK